MVGRKEERVREEDLICFYVPSSTLCLTCSTCYAVCSVCLISLACFDSSIMMIRLLDSSYSTAILNERVYSGIDVVIECVFIHELTRLLMCVNGSLFLLSPPSDMIDLKFSSP